MLTNFRGDRRAKPQATIEAKRGLLRCPACFLVDGVPLLHFTCTLTRCPRVFINIKPPAGVAAGRARRSRWQCASSPSSPIRRARERLRRHLQQWRPARWRARQRGRVFATLILILGNGNYFFEKQ